MMPVRNWRECLHRKTASMERYICRNGCAGRMFVKKFSMLGGNGIHYKTELADICYDCPHWITPAPIENS